MRYLRIKLAVQINNTPRCNSSSMCNFQVVVPVQVLSTLAPGLQFRRLSPGCVVAPRMEMSGKDW